MKYNLNTKGFLAPREIFYHLIEAAKHSLDPTTKVAASLITFQDAFKAAIVSTHVNAIPCPLNQCPETRQDKHDRTIHAEMNCLINQRHYIKLSNAALYCTHQPCSDCTKHIIAFGITKVGWLEPFNGIESADHFITSSLITYRKNWFKSLQLSNKLLDEANVEIKRFNINGEGIVSPFASGIST